MNRFISVVSLSVFILCFFGCKTENYLETCPVSGTVKVDGQPMAGVSIAFTTPASDGRMASGVTNANGVYRLSAPGGKHDGGAEPGTYIPVFTKLEREVFEDLPAEEYEKKYGNRDPKETNLLPEKYSHAKTCGIDPVTVEKGKNNVFNFDLSTK